MEEGLSVQETLKKLWKGKWIISVITIIALLIGYVYSFVIVDPVYKGTSKVSVDNIATVPESVQPFIDELISPSAFSRTLSSTEVLEKVIEQEQLDLSIGQLRSRLTVNLPSDDNSPVVSINSNGTNPEQIKLIVDSVITATITQMETNVQSKLTLIEEEYKLKMEEENENIDLAVKEFNDIQAGEGLPALILFQQNTSSDGQYILEANADILNELRSLDKLDQVNYEKINMKIDNLTSLYNFYNSKYEELRSVGTMNLIDTSIEVISETVVSNEPISPNKRSNMAVALALGLILSLFIVYVKDFFIEEILRKK